MGRLINDLVDDESKLIGRPNPNPILNTCLYNVEFDDGSTHLNSANTIATNFWQQVNAEGYSEATLYSILHYRFDGNV